MGHIIYLLMQLDHVPQLRSKISINGILRVGFFFFFFNHREKGEDSSLTNEDEIVSLNP